MVDVHPDPQMMRRRLMQRRDQLLQRVRQEFGDEDTLLAERDAEWEELSASQRLAGLLDRFGEREVQELARIESAIRRIDAGTYGRCTSCGAQISAERLLALPAASLCAECQELEETTAAPATP